MSWSREERQRFTDDVLDALPGPDAPGVSTNELGDRFGLDPYERSVRLWNVLDRLTRKGLVERIVVAGSYCRYWRRTPAGQRALLDGPADPDGRRP